MSWRLGPIRSNVAIETNADGALLANGVRVTDRDGWIDVRTLACALALGAPAVVALQLRLVHDATAGPRLEAGAVRVRGVSFASVDAVTAPWATFWAASLAGGVWAELERRASLSLRPTRSLRATRPSVAPPTAPDPGAARKPRRDA